MHESAPLRPGLVPEILRQIYVGRRTGLLRFGRRSGGASPGPIDEYCDFRVRRGHIIYGQATPKALHLGEVLVAHGLLDVPGLARATEVVIREKRRLGETLVSLGLLDESQLGHALALHVREMLAHVFGWKDGVYAFEEKEDDEPGHYDLPLPISTGEMILEAVRAIHDREVIGYALGDMERVLLPATDPLLRFQHVTLSAVDGYVLSRVDGTLTAREVMKLTPLPADSVEESLFALFCIGIVEFAEARRGRAQPSTAQFLRQEILDVYGSLTRRTPFELLGVASTASDAEVKAAYFRLAKRYHPDVQHDLPLGDLRDKLEAIFFRLHDAYEAIATEAGRLAVLAPPPPAAPAPPAAKEGRPAPAAAPPPAPASGPRTGRFAVLTGEDLYQRAHERYGEGRYWEAVALLNEAIGLAEGPAVQRMRILLARAYLKSPDWLKHAEKELQTVLQEDAENVEAAYLLGTIYRRGGLSLRAAAMFRRVLALKPNHREAQAELDTLPTVDGTPADKGPRGRFLKGREGTGP